jgi:hypothetical protein
MARPPRKPEHRDPSARDSVGPRAFDSHFSAHDSAFADSDLDRSRRGDSRFVDSRTFPGSRFRDSRSGESRPQDSGFGDSGFADSRYRDSRFVDDFERDDTSEDADDPWPDSRADDEQARGKRAPARRLRRPRTLQVPGRTTTVMAGLIELVLLGAALALLLLGQGTPPGTTLLALVALHALGAGLAFVALRKMQHDEHRSASRWRLAAIGMLVFGPLGLVGAALVGGLARLFARQGRSLQDEAWLQAVGPGSIEVPDPLRSDAKIDATLAARSVVTPFVDVMSRGSTQQKQSLLAIIAAQYRPAYARTVRTALADRESSVRVLAAATTARIESDHLETSMALESAWAGEPTDIGRALALARHYDTFASTDLLDENRAEEARMRALEMYRIAARERPGDESIAQAVIRLLMKLEREDEALGLFRPRIEAGRVTPQMASWYLECLFRRSRFAELRRHSAELVQRFGNAHTLNQRSLQALQLWAHEGRLPSEAMLTDVVDEYADDGDVVRTREQRRHDTQFRVPYFAPNFPTA